MRQCTENECQMNYTELDTQRIKDYIQSHPDGVEVEDIIAHS